ncbi:hypothetical protein Glove_229g128 [Diversispora epigaea]|uniref:Uncharacterized protein n=1 Tax=Diversispora epigaea TaxID=1348612 RepID=A0A397IM08_9GLOM|nr:hypothetical protein Glove_229g128 [Diversispora epigaea]
MSAIATKIVEKYNLSSKTDPSELIDILIPNQKSGKNKTINIVKGSCRIAIASPPKSLEEEIIREIVKRILQNRYRFSEDRVNTLFSIQENGNKNVNIAISNKPSKRMEEETIKDMAQQILRDKLSIRDIRAEAYALALSVLNVNVDSSRLLRLKRELKNIGALFQIIEAIKFSDITENANKIQSVNQKKAEAKHINYPDKFTLESVQERLNAYDLKTPPNYQALADVITIHVPKIDFGFLSIVITMLCIRPAELITLRIIDAGVTGYAKNRDQPDIPRKFRSMEKNQERAKELLT